MKGFVLLLIASTYLHPGKSIVARVTSRELRQANRGSETPFLILNLRCKGNALPVL
jgi:hypothetical protein